MDIMVLTNSSLASSTSQLTDHNSTRITYQHPIDANNHAFFLIGMSFLGGLVAGIVLNCFYSVLFRYFLEQLDWDDPNLPEGHVNLSFIGDECTRPPFHDPPPDYSAVMGLDSGRRRPFFGFFDRFSRSREVDEVDDEECPPPSYSSCLVSLERDLSER